MLESISKLLKMTQIQLSKVFPVLHTDLKHLGQEICFKTKLDAQLLKIIEIKNKSGPGFPGVKSLATRQARDQKGRSFMSFSYKI